MISAGQLSELIEIQRKTNIKTASGAIDYAWEKKCAPRSKVEWLNGSKSMKNGELVTDERISFAIRAHYDIVDTDRIIYGGVKYAIISICRKKNLGVIELIGEAINE